MAISSIQRPPVKAGADQIAGYISSDINHFGVEKPYSPHLAQGLTLAEA